MGRFSEREEQEIIDRYEKGETASALAREFGCSKSTINRMLDRRGIKKHSRSYAIRTGHGHSINENAFDIVTPDSAYWIGFLMADGCVSKVNALNLRLAEKDIDHIKKFKWFLSATHEISTGEKGTGYGKDVSVCSIFQVNSAHLCEELKEYGVVPNKTFIAKVSESLAFNRHFWRGVVDGDGCISWYKSGHYLYPKLSLVGSEFLLQQFRSFVKEIYPSTNAMVTPLKNIFQFHISGKAAEAVIKELYTNAGTALDRKEAKAREVLAFAAERKNKRPKG